LGICEASSEKPEGLHQTGSTSTRGITRYSTREIGLIPNLIASPRYPLSTTRSTPSLPVVTRVASQGGSNSRSRRGRHRRPRPPRQAALSYANRRTRSAPGEELLPRSAACAVLVPGAAYRSVRAAGVARLAWFPHVRDHRRVLPAASCGTTAKTDPKPGWHASDREDCYSPPGDPTGAP
jgi:hypothetical protein